MERKPKLRWAVLKIKERVSLSINLAWEFPALSKQKVWRKGCIHHPIGQVQHAFPEVPLVTAFQSFEGSDIRAEDIKVFIGVGILEVSDQRDIK